MFANLTDKISGIFDKLKGKGVIDEKSLNDALREIRVALLEADVSLEVAKEFIEKVNVKSLGKEVFKSITPGQMIIKIVNDELTNLLGSNKELISSKKKFSKEPATEDDKKLQKQLTLFKEQVEESLQHKDLKKALFSMESMVNPVNQFLDNVQVNCEDKELQNLRYSLLNKISETTDSVVVFSELDNK